jgi:hypothetical protein
MAEKVLCYFVFDEDVVAGENEVIVIKNAPITYDGETHIIHAYVQADRFDPPV